ncbi:MAG: oligopeptide ABC transporter ATP-binding protein [Candidatus Methanomethylicota archaeon]|uniref:Oligopeptide ABC transporter ATP-binding protein n=1 Tax=Thermoproteota archaeon TaxID=2056631 RepID=A0A497EW80_9CREN|nr:MAG: oligopeptide ABC transporter ATP-binding protein [Candidatus Verstraetearchaeota archaeon]
MTNREVIVKAENLKKWFPIKTGLLSIFKKEKLYVRAVDGISFNIFRGETFCLVGESGCGKTTTGRLLLRLLKPTDGRIIFENKDITMTPEKQLIEFRRKTSMISQDPYAAMNPRFTVFEVISEPLTIHKIGSFEEKIEIVSKLLEEVKLTPIEEFLWRFPHQLSGGQRQRVCIARALALNPEFIVADEPVSMLDLSIRAEILQLLRDLQLKRNLTYLYITHDLSTARYFCDRIAVMYLGKIVELSSADEIADNPIHPYTKALIAAVPEPDPSNRLKMREVPIKGEIPSPINIPSGCRFINRCVVYDNAPEKIKKLCKTKEPPLTEVEDNHYVSCWMYIK